MPKLVAVNPNSLSDIWDDISRIAWALDCPAAGEDLIRRLVSEMEDLAHRSQNQARLTPRVLALEWLEPLMSGGNWMPELLEQAGAESLLSETGKHSPWIDFESVERADPDFLLLLPCGFDIERTKQELPTFWKTHPWSRLRAVRDGRVFVLDGNQYFNRPGPRIVDSLGILCEILHGEGEKGRGWERVSP